MTAWKGISMAAVNIKRRTLENRFLFRTMTQAASDETMTSSATEITVTSKAVSYTHLRLCDDDRPHIGVLSRQPGGENQRADCH